MITVQIFRSVQEEISLLDPPSLTSVDEVIITGQEKTRKKRIHYGVRVRRSRICSPLRLREEITLCNGESICK